MRLAGGGGEEKHDEQEQEQEQRRRVRFGGVAGETPSAADDLTATTRRSIRAVRREGAAGEAYPWLNGGAVGRPRPAGGQQAQGRDRRQWQKLNESHKPLGDLQGSALPTRRRGRTPGPSPDAGVGVSAPAIPRSSSLDILSSSLVSSATTAAAKQATKRSRSWRRPMGRASSSGNGGTGGGTSGDEDEEKGTIYFRDAALIAWLNSVLLFEQNDHGKTWRWVLV